jgi:hypothetical protein
LKSPQPRAGIRYDALSAATRSRTSDVLAKKTETWTFDALDSFEEGKTYKKRVARIVAPAGSGNHEGGGV